MARTLRTDEWCVLVRLERWRAEIDGVLRLLGDGRPLPGADSERARQLFAGIKKNFRIELEVAAKLRGYEELSEVERCRYQPAIRLAYCALQSKPNTRPNARWRRELSMARETIVDAIADLRISLTPKRQASTPGAA